MLLSVWTHPVSFLTWIAGTFFPSESFMVTPFILLREEAKSQLSNIGLDPLDSFLWKETLKNPPEASSSYLNYCILLNYTVISSLGKRHQPGTLWTIIIFERTKDYKRTATNSCLQLEYHFASTQKGICWGKKKNCVRVGLILFLLF